MFLILKKNITLPLSINRVKHNNHLFSIFLGGFKKFIFLALRTLFLLLSSVNTLKTNTTKKFTCAVKMECIYVHLCNASSDVEKCDINIHKTKREKESYAKITFRKKYAVVHLI